jgi:hypothetical protein
MEKVLVSCQVLRLSRVSASRLWSMSFMRATKSAASTSCPLLRGKV